MFNIAFGIAIGLAFFCVFVQPSGTIPAKHWWQSNMDATDDPVNNKHSGLVLYIDTARAVTISQPQCSVPLPLALMEKVSRYVSQNLSPQRTPKFINRKTFL
jgi:hypothetical protein